MMNRGGGETRARRLLFVHSSDELYGSDNVLLQLLQGLDRQRFEPTVVLPSDVPYEGRLSRALMDAGIRCYHVEMGVLRRRYLHPLGLAGYLRRLLDGVSRLKSLIREHEIELVHSNTTAVIGGALAARACRLPHLWHVHEILEEPAWLTGLLYRFVAANSTRVVAISQAVAEHIEKNSRGADIVIIRNGIDCARFTPEVDGQGLRERWGIDPGTVLAGVVGRISHWKGQELFLEAAAQAAVTCGQLRFAIIGDCPPGDETRLADLRLRGEQLGISNLLRFVPFTPDVPRLMHALDVLVLPSTSPEPFGMVVLEAMASGRPVVASAHGGPLETVEPGVTGLLFPPRDAAALAGSMVTIAQDRELAATMGRAARHRACESFSVDRFRQKFHELYGSMVG